MSGGLSRRALLGAGAGLAAGAALGRGTSAVGETASAAVGPTLKRPLLPPERIGLQLYSVRDAVAELGFAPVLEKVAEYGYKCVEFAGYTQGTTPEITLAELKALLDANGLTPVASHVSPGDDASMTRILDEAAVLGIPNVGISLLLPNGPFLADSWKSAAQRWDHYGEMARQRGVGFYLHNHFEEWLPVPDDLSRRGIDIILEETNPQNVFFELDIFWAYVGQAQSLLTPFDPLTDYAIPFRDRFKLFHVKDGMPATVQMTDVGEGEIDFQEFFTELFKQSSGQEHEHYYLWEYDDAANHPRGPLAAALASFVHMRHGLYVPATARTADGAFSASVVRTAFRRRRGRRVLEVTLRLSAPATVTGRLSRGGRRLARVSRGLGEGTSRLQIPLKRSVAAGAAQLDLSISNGAGVSLSLRDAVRIPSGSRA